MEWSYIHSNGNTNSDAYKYSYEGCDSLATLNLTVDPTLTSTTDITICDAELPYSWNGLTFTTTESQTATLTSVVTGCDSLATLNNSRSNLNRYYRHYYL